MRLLPLILFVTLAFSPQAVKAQGRSVLTLLDVEGRMLAIGDTSGGELGASDFTLAHGQPAQAWGMEGQGGTPITIDLMSEDFDAYIFIVGPGIEEPLVDDDGGGGCNARVSFRPQQEGLFRVVVSTVGSSLGMFRVAASAVPGDPVMGGCENFDQLPFLRSLSTDARTLAMGDSIEGQLIEGDRRNEAGVLVQAWSLQATPGASVTVDLVSDNFDSYLYVLSPDIAGALSDDDGGGACHSRLTVPPTESGEYTVIVSTVGAEDDGVFRLSASAAPGPVLETGCGSAGAEPLDDLSIDGRMLRIESESAGELTGADHEYSDGSYVQAWGLELTAGQPVTVDLISSDFDSYLYVAGPGLTDRLYDDDGAGGCHARISFFAPAEGLYRIVASSVGAGVTGGFTLRVSSRSGPQVETASCLGGEDDAVLNELSIDGRQVAIGESVVGALDDDDPKYTDGSFVEAWGLSLSAGDYVAIDLKSGEFDSFLYVTGPGAGVLSDDDGGGGCDARVAFTAPETGVYRVVAGSLIAGQSGRFTISVSETPEPVSTGDCSLL